LQDYAHATGFSCPCRLLLSPAEQSGDEGNDPGKESFLPGRDLLPGFLLLMYRSFRKGWGNLG
jgi:hypothetical protein